MQFDDRGAERGGRIKLFRVRFDKERHANTRIGQFPDNRLQKVMAANGVQPAFGCTLLPLFRHDTYRMR